MRSTLVLSNTLHRLYKMYKGTLHSWIYQGQPLIREKPAISDRWTVADGQARQIDIYLMGQLE
jgi:hypothetical protein